MYVFFNIITVLTNFVPFKTNHCFFPLRYVFMVNADIYGVGLKKTPNITDCEYLLDSTFSRAYH